MSPEGGGSLGAEWSEQLKEHKRARDPTGQSLLRALSSSLSINTGV